MVQRCGFLVVSSTAAFLADSCCLQPAAVAPPKGAASDSAAPGEPGIEFARVAGGIDSIFVVACCGEFNEITKDNEHTGCPANVGNIGRQAIPRVVRGKG